jgi:RNA polymerase sigma-H factor
MKKKSSKKTKKTKKTKKLKQEEKIDLLDLEEIEKEDAEDVEDVEDVEDAESKKVFSNYGNGIEDILFKLPNVKNPLCGSPKEIQEDLDNIALKIQKSKDQKSNEELFNMIHVYMHGYLLNVTLKQFPFIKGMETVDIYQETLIAIRFKAIPNFELGKGMSFLSFSKLCIRRHLITLLNASKNKQKDQPINTAISLDSTPSSDSEEGSSNTFANLIADKNMRSDEEAEISESFDITKKNLMDNLSDFEQMVLEEYLTSSSYKEIAKNISKKNKIKCPSKAVDNALLRIRKKAQYLIDHSKKEDFPMFME